MIENAYDKLDGIEKFQLSAIFYVSGFLASKYSQLQSTSGGFGEECDFTDLISRGKLSYPTQELFDFFKVCFVVFEEIKNELSNGSFQKPRDYLITLFEEINNALFFVDPFGLSCSQFKSLYRRIANVFLKGYVTKQTDDIALQKKESTSAKLKKLDASINK